MNNEFVFVQKRIMPFVLFMKIKVLAPSLPYISARNMPGGKYGYFDVIMVLHIISYK